MTKRITITLLALAILGLSPTLANADEACRIYGKITTFDGEVLTGFIRWDKNEGCWHDVLDGNKQRPDLDRSARRRWRERDNDFMQISFFGSSAQSGIAFGHIAKLRPLGDDEALLILRSGQEIEFESGSTDIGRDVREIVIEDATEGELELDWDDIDEIEFMQAPAGAKSVMGDRLYGTVTVRRGETFTGYIAWDVDEAFSTDVLDGYERGRKRKIRFGNIKSIERHGSGASLVTTDDGEEIRLEDSNDVDSDNSGIVISDPGLGRIVVGWDEFDRADFTPAPKGIGTWDKFNGGKTIVGVVTTDGGDTFEGEIIWDADEMHTWEILDGEFRDIELDVFFENIASIEHVRRGSEVRLRDGRTFYLRGSNDVDEDNKGVYIKTANGRVEELDWDYFVRLDLKH